MDQPTVAVYEREASRWFEARSPQRVEAASAFSKNLSAEALRADLGCGPGFHLEALGAPVLAMDAAGSMLTLARELNPNAWFVQGDLEALPIRKGALGGAWAEKSYLHVPRERLPMALADLHAALAVDALFELSMILGDTPGPRTDDDFPGRNFHPITGAVLSSLVRGAGFMVRSVVSGDRFTVVRGQRLRSLPDTVGPDMRVLVCGLNPSLYAADAGVGFARPGNRFWPAALEAGLVTKDRDAHHAYLVDRVGMTDIVKRATTSADQLEGGEYDDGLFRVEELVKWLEPRLVCFVGLAGYRSIIDPKAQPGEQSATFGGTPVYLVPSTSGLNAGTKPAEFVEHFRALNGLVRESTDG